MPYFDDFAAGVSAYPAASVQLSIVDVNPPGTAINVNENVLFQVRIRNNGHLNLTGVTLHVIGINGVEVSRTGGAGTFGTLFTSLPININAHSSQDTVNFFFRSSAVRPAGTALVRAHIAGYDVNLTDLLTNHTGHPNPLTEATFAAQVHPS
ncbi:MAG: hypothetical protein IPK76_18380 [Lewinellaceae bacterium]|jgi:hypothetical protein|nr:hypothetical protein [Lewinellaceae bacterium]